MTDARARAIRSAVRNYLYPMTESQMMNELDIAIKAGDTVLSKRINEYIEECRNGPDGFAG